MEGNKVARQKVWVFSFALFPANQPSHCLLLTSIRPCIHPSPFLLCSFTLSGSVWDVKGILWVTVTHTHSHNNISSTTENISSKTYFPILLLLHPHQLLLLPTCTPLLLHLLLLFLPLTFKCSLLPYLLHHYHHLFT